MKFKIANGKHTRFIFIVLSEKTSISLLFMWDQIETAKDHAIQ